MVNGPILIVGGGPTGLTLAAELIRQGVLDITVIDKLPGPLRQTKASVTWPRSLELLERYEGVLPALHNRCDFVHRVVLHRNPTSVFREVPLSAHLSSKHPHGVLVEQWYMEECLRAHLACANVAVQYDSELVGYEYNTDASCVIATIVRKKGTPDETTTATAYAFVVGCDGARSGIRKLMGISFSGVTMPLGFVGVHFKSTTPVTLVHRDALSIVLYDDGGSFITAMPNDSYLAIVDLSLAQDAAYVSPDEVDAHGYPVQRALTRDEMQALLASRVSPEVAISEVLWSTHFRVNARVATKYSDSQRIFLCGDACHCHTPLLGQGMNVGIQDAVNLGWKLALVVRGVATPTLLASYGDERLIVGQELIAMTTRAQTAFSHRHPVFQQVRNSVVGGLARSDRFLDIWAPNLCELSTNYRRNPGLTAESWTLASMVSHPFVHLQQLWLQYCKTSRVCAGDRWPYEKFSSLSSKASTGFELYLFQGLEGYNSHSVTVGELEAVVREVTLAFPGLVTQCRIELATNEALYATIGVLGQCLFLIRPDGYVGLRSEPGNVDDVSAYLRQRVVLPPAAQA
ncbi:hypothetical protein ACHHYP_08103 [Achlya hypogyna]|uniref:FAD-binding domain-containing protein n=1 Tax=Achlya hypogyna TaxID=1202772 RepID=A0A1V9YPW0_ACHHY|nr:hypothetical protein ACHHYP_08103 [Achlya hypogyna]